jgi:hypothetical protein
MPGALDVQEPPSVRLVNVVDPPTQIVDTPLIDAREFTVTVAVE